MPSYDLALAEALVRGYSQRKSAVLAGVSEGMVRKRLQQEDFQALLAQKRDEMGDDEPVRWRLSQLLALLQDVYVETGRFEKDPMTRISAEETRRHLAISIQFLDEWVYVLEEECAS